MYLPLSTPPYLTWLQTSRLPQPKHTNLLPFHKGCLRGGWKREMSSRRGKNHERRCAFISRPWKRWRKWYTQTSQNGDNTASCSLSEQ
jgi:hypothetical protein